jgi:hypothetical protein
MANSKIPPKNEPLWFKEFKDELSDKLSGIGSAVETLRTQMNCIDSKINSTQPASPSWAMVGLKWAMWWHVGMG